MKHPLTEYPDAGCATVSARRKTDYSPAGWYVTHPAGVYTNPVSFSKLWEAQLWVVERYVVAGWKKLDKEGRRFAAIPGVWKAEASKTDGDILLRQVCDTPEDDTVRLIYADWLEDNQRGEEADFIRKQIALALAGDVGLDHPYKGDKAGLGGFSIVSGTLEHEMALRNFGNTALFRRGFVDKLYVKYEMPCVTNETLVEHLFRRHPITAVELGWLTLNFVIVDTSVGTVVDRAMLTRVNDGMADFLGPKSFDDSWAYATVKDAREALSEAFVAYGRSLAKLSPRPVRKALSYPQEV